MMYAIIADGKQQIGIGSADCGVCRRAILLRAQSVRGRQTTISNYSSEYEHDYDYDYDYE